MSNKRFLELTLSVEGGNAVVEILAPECGDCISIIKPYSPLDHAEFDKEIGAEIYDWFMMLEEEMEEDQNT